MSAETHSHHSCLVFACKRVEQEPISHPIDEKKDSVILFEWITKTQKIIFSGACG